MPVGLTDYVQPLGSFAIAHDDDLLGSYRSVPDTATRDAIPTGRRKAGMLVRAQDTGKIYILGSGLTNSDWAVANFGGSSGDNGSALRARQIDRLGKQGPQTISTSDPTIIDGMRAVAIIQGIAFTTTLDNEGHLALVWADPSTGINGSLNLGFQNTTASEIISYLEGLDVAKLSFFIPGTLYTYNVVIALDVSGAPFLSSFSLESEVSIPSFTSYRACYLNTFVFFVGPDNNVYVKNGFGSLQIAFSAPGSGQLTGITVVEGRIYVTGQINGINQLYTLVPYNINGNLFETSDSPFPLVNFYSSLAFDGSVVWGVAPNALGCIAKDGREMSKFIYDPNEGAVNRRVACDGISVYTTCVNSAGEGSVQRYIQAASDFLDGNSEIVLVAERDYALSTEPRGIAVSDNGDLFVGILTPFHTSTENHSDTILAGNNTYQFLPTSIVITDSTTAPVGGTIAPTTITANPTIRGGRIFVEINVLASTAGDPNFLIEVLKNGTSYASTVFTEAGVGNFQVQIGPPNTDFTSGDSFQLQVGKVTPSSDAMNWSVTWGMTWEYKTLDVSAVFSTPTTLSISIPTGTLVAIHEMEIAIQADSPSPDPNFTVSLLYNGSSIIKSISFTEVLGAQTYTTSDGPISIDFNPQTDFLQLLVTTPSDPISIDWSSFTISIPYIELVHDFPSTTSTLTTTLNSSQFDYTVIQNSPDTGMLAEFVINGSVVSSDFFIEGGPGTSGVLLSNTGATLNTGDVYNYRVKLQYDSLGEVTWSGVTAITSFQNPSLAFIAYRREARDDREVGDFKRFSVEYPDGFIKVIDGRTYTTPSGIGFNTEAQGDIAYRDVSDWENLHAGTAGQILTTQGPSANPIWADPPSSSGTGDDGTALRQRHQGRMGRVGGSPTSSDVINAVTYPANGIVVIDEVAYYVTSSFLRSLAVGSGKGNAATLPLPDLASDIIVARKPTGDSVYIAQQSNLSEYVVSVDYTTEVLTPTATAGAVFTLDSSSRHRLTVLGNFIYATSESADVHAVNFTSNADSTGYTHTSNVISITSGDGLVYISDDTNNVVILTQEPVAGGLTLLSTTPIGTILYDMTFDGKNVWGVAGSGDVVVFDTAHKVGVHYATTLTNDSRVTFDGFTVWVTEGTGTTDTGFRRLSYEDFQILSLQKFSDGTTTEGRGIAVSESGHIFFGALIGSDTCQVSLYAHAARENNVGSFRGLTLDVAQDGYLALSSTGKVFVPGGLPGPQPNENGTGLRLNAPSKGSAGIASTAAILLAAGGSLPTDCHSLAFDGRYLLTTSATTDNIILIDPVSLQVTQPLDMGGSVYNQVIFLGYVHTQLEIVKRYAAVGYGVRFFDHNVTTDTWTSNIPVLIHPAVGSWFDGNNLWVVDVFNTTLSRFDSCLNTTAPTSIVQHTASGSLDGFSTGTFSNQMVGTKNAVWVLLQGTPGTLFRCGFDGSVTSASFLNSDNPKSITYDGRFLYIVVDGATDVRVMMLDPEQFNPSVGLVISNPVGMKTILESGSPIFTAGAGQAPDTLIFDGRKVIALASGITSNASKSLVAIDPDAFAQGNAPFTNETTVYSSVDGFNAPKGIISIQEGTGTGTAVYVVGVDGLYKIHESTPVEVKGIVSKGSIVNSNFRIVTSNGPVLGTDHTILSNSTGTDITLTLFSNPRIGQELVFKDIAGLTGVSTLIYAPVGSTIDGAGFYIIATNYGAIGLRCVTSTSWFTF